MKAFRANPLAWHRGRAGSTHCLSAADGAPEYNNLQDMSDEVQLGMVIFATSLASSLRKCLSRLLVTSVLCDSGVFLSPNVPYNPRITGERQMPPPAHAKDSTYFLNYCLL